MADSLLIFSSLSLALSFFLKTVIRANALVGCGCHFFFWSLSFFPPMQMKVTHSHMQTTAPQSQVTATQSFARELLYIYILLRAIFFTYTCNCDSHPIANQSFASEHSFIEKKEILCSAKDFFAKRELYHGSKEHQDKQIQLGSCDFVTHTHTHMCVCVCVCACVCVCVCVCWYMYTS